MSVNIVHYKLSHGSSCEVSLLGLYLTVKVASPQEDQLSLTSVSINVTALDEVQ